MKQEGYDFGDVGMLDLTHSFLAADCIFESALRQLCTEIHQQHRRYLLQFLINSSTSNSTSLKSERTSSSCDSSSETWSSSSSTRPLLHPTIVSRIIENRKKKDHCHFGEL